MTNTQEAQFEQPPYPRQEEVSLPKPAGSTRDEAILWAEAEVAVQERLKENEYVQHRSTLSERRMGERSIWDASFQIGLQEETSEEV
ncbi:hypothetical protein [Paenarthrobacter sp. NCHU4564]|uniref:hypothetical protein n=1 Tax=Paenarthrobacter sp. NCHU4564 TaxID=3451353 RepID=UPI003F9A76AD